MDLTQLQNFKTWWDTQAEAEKTANQALVEQYLTDKKAAVAARKGKDDTIVVDPPAKTYDFQRKPDLEDLIEWATGA